MFLMVGLVYDRAHTRYIPDLAAWPVACRS